MVAIMTFSGLAKAWSGLMGMIRFARILGYLNFVRFFLKQFWYRPKFFFVDYKGMPVPAIGCNNPNDFVKLLDEDLANFKTRDEDVYVVAFAKSGHHWSYDIINMLLKGNFVLDKIGKEAFFLEFLLPAANGMEPFDRLPSPRVIYTHYHADALPTEVFTKKRKIVRLIRNPKDVAVSGFHHRNSMAKKNLRPMVWDEFIEQLMDSIEGIREFDEPFFKKGSDWFTYELDCEHKMNHLSHAIVIHYEDLKEDTVTELKRLAKFFDREYEDSFLEEVAIRTNMSYIKKNRDMSTHDAFTKGGSLYRKGIIGDWKNHFTLEQAKRFDAIIETKMNGCPLMQNIRFE